MDKHSEPKCPNRCSSHKAGSLPKIQDKADDTDTHSLSGTDTEGLSLVPKLDSISAEITDDIQGVKDDLSNIQLQYTITSMKLMR